MLAISVIQSFEIDHGWQFCPLSASFVLMIYRFLLSKKLSAWKLGWGATAFFLNFFFKQWAVCSRACMLKECCTIQNTHNIIHIVLKLRHDKTCRCPLFVKNMIFGVTFLKPSIYVEFCYHNHWLGVFFVHSKCICYWNQANWLHFHFVHRKMINKILFFISGTGSVCCVFHLQASRVRLRWSVGCIPPWALKKNIT